MKKAVSVIVGYIAMALFTMVTGTVAWFGLGAEFAFEPGTTVVTPGWLALNFLFGLTGAIIGGFICAKMSKSARTVNVFAVIIFLFALISAVLHIMTDDPSEAAGKAQTGLNAMEALSEGIQPPWYNFVIAFIGAAGILVGGRLGRRAAPPSSDVAAN